MTMRTKAIWTVLSNGLLAGCAGPAIVAEEEAHVEEEAEAEPSIPTVSSPESQEMLTVHNAAREEHCAPPLTWSDELAQVAAGWAAELRSRGCPLEHSQSAYGENLFMATAGTGSAPAAVEAWVEERAGYRFSPGGFSMRTGHFTQVVWVGTQRLGCANLECEGMDLWVCNYDPAGNVEGQYRENVLPSTCAR